MDPMGQTAAFAFVADNLNTAGKDNEWADHFAPLFATMVKSMHARGLIDALVDSCSVQTPAAKFRRSQIVKSIHAWARMEVIKARKVYYKASSLRDEALGAKESIVDTFIRLMTYFDTPSLQSPLIASDGSISTNFSQLVSVLQKGYDILAKDDGMNLSISNLESLTRGCDGVLAYLCRIHPADNVTTVVKSGLFDSKLFAQLPVPSSWQNQKCKAISLRCYNLCVSFNVSQFSGWEAYEFSLRVMKSRAHCNYFGLVVHKDRVAGFVPSVIEEELAKQWDILGVQVVAAKEFNFRDRLATVKELDWYKEGIDRHEDALAEKLVGLNSEQEGLQVLLSHSHVCLQLAAEKKATEKTRLLMTSLSVLLPIVSVSLKTNETAAKVIFESLTLPFLFCVDTILS